MGIWEKEIPLKGADLLQLRGKCMWVVNYTQYLPTIIISIGGCAKFKRKKMET